jgi:outer membrane beta-barrel protein
VRGAYHVTEDIFLEAFLARSKAGIEQPRDDVSRHHGVSNSGRQFTYYDLDVGYNILPGEIFLGRGHAFNSALYVTAGMGDVKFADKDQFALNFGVGERLLITDWLARCTWTSGITSSNPTCSASPRTSTTSKPPWD